MKRRELLNVMLLWLPAIGISAIIFVLTFQPPGKTANLSMSVQETVVSSVTSTGVERGEVINSWWYNFSNFRKLAHVIEYLPLGIAMAIPMILKKFPKPITYSFMLCFIVSFVDQLLKGILPTREFDGKDLCLDLVGYSIGITISLLVMKTYYKMKGTK